MPTQSNPILGLGGLRPEARVGGHGLAQEVRGDPGLDPRQEGVRGVEERREDLRRRPGLLPLPPELVRELEALTCCRHRIEWLGYTPLFLPGSRPRSRGPR